MRKIWKFVNVFNNHEMISDSFMQYNDVNALENDYNFLSDSQIISVNKMIETEKNEFKSKPGARLSYNYKWFFNRMIKNTFKIKFERFFVTKDQCVALLHILDNVQSKNIVQIIESLPFYDVMCGFNEAVVEKIVFILNSLPDEFYDGLPFMVLRLKKVLNPHVPNLFLSKLIVEIVNMVFNLKTFTVFLQDIDVLEFFIANFYARNSEIDIEKLTSVINSAKSPITKMDIEQCITKIVEM